MKHRYSILVIIISAMLVSITVRSDDTFEHGGDVYLGADDATMATDVGRDSFVAGFSVKITGDVAQDAHAAGFNVEVDGDVGGDLYAAGSNVRVDGKVGKDLTASGFTVLLDSDAMVLGNARIAGGTVNIDAPIAGSLLVSGGTVKLNESIQGDVRVIAPDIKFGVEAVINGTLSYSAKNEMVIPSSVIPADRVRFTQIKRGDTFRELRDTMDDSVPDFWPVTFASRIKGLVLLLAFLLILSVVILAFAPESVERLRRRATEHAWRSIFYGFIGLSTLVGAILVSAITIVGIPLVPIVLLAVVVVWTLGYLLGVYVIATRIWRSLDFSPQAVFPKLLILASGLIAMVIVNWVPFFGWLINIGVVFFGVGAMTYLVMERLVRRHDASGQKALTNQLANGDGNEG